MKKQLRSKLTTYGIAALVTSSLTVLPTSATPYGEGNESEVSTSQNRLAELLRTVSEAPTDRERARIYLDIIQDAGLLREAIPQIIQGLENFQERIHRDPVADKLCAACGPEEALPLMESVSAVRDQTLLVRLLCDIIGNKPILKVALPRVVKALENIKDQHDSWNSLIRRVLQDLSEEDAPLLMEAAAEIEDQNLLFKWYWNIIKYPNLMWGNFYIVGEILGDSYRIQEPFLRQNLIREVFRYLPARYCPSIVSELPDNKSSLYFAYEGMIENKEYLERRLLNVLKGVLKLEDKYKQDLLADIALVYDVAYMPGEEEKFLLDITSKIGNQKAKGLYMCGLLQEHLLTGEHLASLVEKIPEIGDEPSRNTCIFTYVSRCLDDDTTFMRLISKFPDERVRFSAYQSRIAQKVLASLKCSEELACEVQNFQDATYKEILSTLIHFSLAEYHKSEGPSLVANASKIPDEGARIFALSIAITRNKTLLTSHLKELLEEALRIEDVCHRGHLLQIICSNYTGDITTLVDTFKSLGEEKADLTTLYQRIPYNPKLVEDCLRDILKEVLEIPNEARKCGILRLLAQNYSGEDSILIDAILNASNENERLCTLSTLANHKGYLKTHLRRIWEEASQYDQHSNPCLLGSIARNYEGDETSFIVKSIFELDRQHDGSLKYILVLTSGNITKDHLSEILKYVQENRHRFGPRGEGDFWSSLCWYYKGREETTLLDAVSALPNEEVRHWAFMGMTNNEDKRLIIDHHERIIDEIQRFHNKVWKRQLLIRIHRILSNQ